MKLVLDYRESDLIAIINAISQSKPPLFEITTENLPIGDIVIRGDGDSDLVVIERKTLQDLAASIRDGRYNEQSFRLDESLLHNHNIIYLIEGDIFRFNAFKERFDKQTLYSAMFSVNYFKGFSIMRSNNLEETAMIACNMVYKLVSGLKAGKHSFYNNIKLSNETSNEVSSCETNTTNNLDTIKEPTEKDYCSVIKKVKKENVTPENIGEIMLCQIPGVSSVSALAILNQFKTLPNLIKSIQEDETCLNNIFTTDANGKNRKISKTALATIIKYLKV